MICSAHQSRTVFLTEIHSAAETSLTDILKLLDMLENLSGLIFQQVKSALTIKEHRRDSLDILQEEVSLVLLPTFKQKYPLTKQISWFL